MVYGCVWYGVFCDAIGVFCGMVVHGALWCSVRNYTVFVCTLWTSPWTSALIVPVKQRGSKGS